MRALTLPLPPAGSATILLQTRHLITVDGLPNMICSFLHLEQRTLMNFEDNSRIMILALFWRIYKPNC